MDSMMYTCVDTMNAQQQKLDMISNNIANVNTDGYKSANVGFSDLLYETSVRLGTPVTDNTGRLVDPQYGTGVKSTEMIRDNKQGSLMQTGLKANLAIDGEGYFRVIRPNGSYAYTRSGDFQLDTQGRLVDNNGDRLDIAFNNGAVALGNDNYTVADDGTLSVNNSAVGKINIYDAVGSDAMVSVGDNLYVPKNGAQVFVNNNVSIKQGYVETSNVDAATEMTNMIVAQRAFELGSKGVSVADNMMSIINNLVQR
ncbi:MAG: flagellar hook-basal body complex protein [Clostridium sp.]|nr:flagellar hook-basal body complex protein [Clostridium sp.]